MTVEIPTVTEIVIIEPDGTVVEIAGNRGPQGVKGDTGDQGPQGGPGPQGETGPQGSQGIQGVKGDTGDTGPAADTSALLVKANNLSDIANAETARQNLGLGTMSTATASDYLSKAGNLSGIADPAAARTNLGLGTMATEAASAYALLAGATFTGATMVDGTADAIQSRIQGHSTQTANLQTWETSAGTVVGSVSGSGAFTSNISSNVYLTGGGTLSGTPNPGLNIINRFAGGYDPLIQGRSATSAGNLKTVFVIGATGASNWADATVANQISDFYILTRGTGDALVERMRISSAGVITAKGQHFVDGSEDVIQSRVQGHSTQTANLQTWENSSASVLASISAAGLHRWNSAGNEQTTVGAAGGASALPGTPTKYLKVVDSSGATLVIPAYAAA